MRLLNCLTQELEEFFGADIPRYAILSHTWEEEEVVYKDITSTNTDYKAKVGWYKIQACCQQALRDKLDYVWVDTICIDKSSSAELTEAINSMFNWYRDSAVCYAYLCDIPQTHFQSSRWFTRGWTLQELIAPDEVLFYDKSWGLQGSKRTMLNKLQQITGIDITVLCGADLTWFSVSKKMSWVSRRETTREEDLAYCLLGIFGIAMPLLYGEGPKAFIRLQEQILREYDDESLFAWTSSDLDISCGLLAPSPKAFSSSSHFVPCLTQAPIPVGPIAATNRGIRLEVPVEQVSLQDGTAYVIRLNCKPMSFEWVTHTQFTRVGIFVTPVGKIQGYPSSTSAYVRIRPQELHLFEPNLTISPYPIFLLKENHLRYDMVTYDYFWVRNMPAWPHWCSYTLAAVHPSENWSPNDATFKRHKASADEDRPFVLVFRRYSSEDIDWLFDHYIIAFGGEMAGFEPREGVLGFWCDAVFRRVKDVAELDLESEVQALSRKERTVEVEGEGTTLRCAIRSEIISGHQLFCVDLLVQPT